MKRQVLFDFVGLAVGGFYWFAAVLVFASFFDPF